ncbi:unnamed protein product, partial [Polarella glacialis]
DRWESCWEWVQYGYCPRLDTCRWEHPAHMQMHPDYGAGPSHFFSGEGFEAHQGMGGMMQMGAVPMAMDPANGFGPEVAGQYGAYGGGFKGCGGCYGGCGGYVGACGGCGGGCEGGCGGCGGSSGYGGCGGCGGGLVGCNGSGGGGFGTSVLPCIGLLLITRLVLLLLL